MRPLRRPARDERGLPVTDLPTRKRRDGRAAHDGTTLAERAEAYRQEADQLRREHARLVYVEDELKRVMAERDRWRAKAGEYAMRIVDGDDDDA